MSLGLPEFFGFSLQVEESSDKIEHVAQVDAPGEDVGSVKVM
jgi:hypothetical protein